MLSACRKERSHSSELVHSAYYRDVGDSSAEQFDSHTITELHRRKQIIIDLLKNNDDDGVNEESEFSGETCACWYVQSCFQLETISEVIQSKSQEGNDAGSPACVRWRDLFDSSD